MSLLPVNRSPLNILLVEDNSAEALLAKLAIRETDSACNLNVVKDGQAAIDYLRKEQEYREALTPDLILLDLNLPKKTGKQVLAEIKTDETFRHIPVIVLSNSTDHGDIIDCYRLHANCYITKPFMFEIFVGIISSVIHYWNTVVQLPITEMGIFNDGVPGQHDKDMRV